MADDIVQTIKIEVDGANEAASEIKKVGQATEEVQKVAEQTGGGTQELGKGLDQVSQKSGISSRELRSLSKIAKEFGADTVVVGLSLVRMAAVLGPIGAALFAVGAAFSFVKDKMKEADEAAKAVANTFATLAQKSADTKLKDEAAFWGMDEAAMKKWNNEASRVVDQYKNIQSGRQKAISADVSPEARQTGLIENLKQAGVQFDDVNAGAEKLNENGNKALMFFAKLADKLAPIGMAQLAKDMKAFGFTDAQIKSVEKGSAALKKAQDDAAKFNASPAGQGLKAFDAAVVESQKTVEGWGQTLKIKFAEAVLGWKKIFAGGFGFFGEVLAEAGRNIVGGLVSIGSSIAQAVSAWVSTKVEGAWQWIADTATSAWEQAKALAQQAYDAVVLLVTTAPGAAWQWIADTAASVWASVKTGAQQAWDAVVSFVTTPVANAWQWIKDMWNANVPKFLQFGGGGGGGQTPATATQGMAGGGLLGGRGSGTSDSNLAWVSRGEHIMPARAVSQPGVLAFLEALRFSGGNLRGVLDGMGRFALGGMVRAPISIPAFAGGGGMSNVTIQFPGLPEITGLRASSGVVDQLRHAAAMAQVRSGGRKPSRYS